jgi:hypothetical protein
MQLVSSVIRLRNIVLLEKLNIRSEACMSATCCDLFSLLSKYESRLYEIMSPPPPPKITFELVDFHGIL